MQVIFDGQYRQVIRFLSLISFFHFCCLAICAGQGSDARTKEIWVLLDSADLLELTNPSVSLAYSLKALQQTPREEYPDLRVEALIFASNAEKVSGQPASAHKYIDEAIHISRSISDQNYLLRAYFMKASIFGVEGIRDSALVYFHRVIEMYKPGMKIYQVANAYSNIGGIFNRMGQHKEAEAYLLKGFELSRQDRYSWVFTLSRLIAFYSARNDPKYVHYIDTFLQSDFAKQNSESAVSAHFEILLNIADASAERREDVLASLYANTRSQGQSLPAHQVYFGLKYFQQLHKNGRFNEGQILLEDLLKIATTENEHRSVAQIHEAMYTNAKAMGKWPDALHHLERYRSMIDSLRIGETNAKINELNIKFEVSQKDHEISRQALLLEQAKRRRNLLIMVAVLLFALAGLTWFYFRNKVASAKRIAQQQETIHLQETERLVQQNELGLLHATLESQEKERNRIARDLHDGIGSLMSGISAHVEVLKPVKEDHQTYESLRRLVKETSSEIRRTSHELLPAGLLKHGLEASIRDLGVNMLMKNNIDTTIEINTDLSDISTDRQLILYRMIQELLQNIVKHARASEVLIQCNKYENEIALIVEDNGVGFDPQTQTQTGLGLGSLQSRIALLGGKIDIDSERGVGTTVTINFPLAMNA